MDTQEPTTRTTSALGLHVIEMLVVVGPVIIVDQASQSCVVCQQANAQEQSWR